MPDRGGERYGERFDSTGAEPSRPRVASWHVTDRGLDDSAGEAAGSPPPGLPRLAGGWECRRHTLGPVTVALWTPRAPDALLDDPAVHERNRFHDAMPYWAWLWDSAPALARLVAEACAPARGARVAEPAVWPRGARVLELGAGLGLVGLTAARMGCHVTLTDHDPLALEAARVNVAANGVEAVAEVEALDWRAPDMLAGRTFEVVLGCDVVYEANAHEPVLDVLERALTPEGVAWVADPGRARTPAFVRRAEARGFRVESTDAAGRPAALAPGEFRRLALRRR